MSVPSRLFALLVGIDHYQSASVADLRGCVADVHATRAFLTTSLGVPDARITLLTSAADDQGDPARRATRRNILVAWERIISALQPGDQFFFHYSGHGSQAKSANPNEPDGFDETLVPCDSRDADERGRPVFDILDKELAALIERMETRGITVTVFLDCCHSGSGTRAIGGLTEDLPQRPGVRVAPSDYRLRPAGSLVAGASEWIDRAPSEAHEQAAGAPSAPTSGWRIGGGHVLLAGCRDEELSHEYRSPETGAWHGATTYFLLQALQGYHEGLTWRQVHDVVQTRVNALYARQSPQLEGPGHRIVFGGLAAPEVPHLLATAVEEGDHLYVRLNGGAAVGLSEGSQVALHPPGPIRFDREPLARGVVERTRADHAWARVTTPLSLAELPIPSQVTITARGYGNQLYTVAVADVLLRRTLSAPVAAGAAPVPLVQSPFLQIADANDPGAVFRVTVEQERYVVRDGSGTQLLAQTEPRTPAGAARTTSHLGHLAIYNNVRNLRNPLPLPALDAAVALSAVSYTRLGEAGPLDPLPLEGPAPVLPPGRSVQLTIENRSDETLYLSVFTLSAAYGIHRIYPAVAPFQTVAGGRAVVIDGISPRAPAHVVEKGREILKVFITRDPTSFDVLEMPALNQEQPEEIGAPRASGPLAGLLNGLRREGTRTLLLRDDNTHQRWSTQQIEFLVLAEKRVQRLEKGCVSVGLGTPLSLSLQAPTDFEADLIVSSRFQLLWGENITLPLPAGLDVPDAHRFFEPISFSGEVRPGAGSAGVLAISATSQHLRAIHESTPLTLSLSIAGDPDLVGIVCLAFDGEFFVPAGSAVARSLDAGKATRAGERLLDERRIGVAITHLPRPVDSPTAAGAAPDRHHTVRLIFYKVYGGALSAEAGLRRVIVDENGEQNYAPIQRDYLATSRRVALFLHGINSSSRWFLDRALPRLRPHIGYDSVLSFDYDSIDTALADSGARLRQALREAGFGADDSVALDIYCHGAGALLARVLVEVQEGDRFVDRVFQLGPPNQGTELVESRQLFRWLGTLAVNARGVGPVGRVATWLLNRELEYGAAVDDLRPGSRLLRLLNGRPRLAQVPYYVQVGCADGAGGTGGADRWQRLFSQAGLAQRAGAGLDALLGGANDLLVSARSAEHVCGGAGTKGASGRIAGHHFHYLQSDESIDELVGWLHSDREREPGQ